MALVKIFCVLFTVILYFGEIRANVDHESAAPARHKLSSSAILPPSILYLLRKGPSKRPSQTVGPEVATPPSAPLAPSPVSPNFPTNSNIPSAPLQPSPPFSPSAPIPPSASIPPRQPIPYYTQGISAQDPHPPINLTPLPGQLSYNNPANGNRKLLNVVNVPLRQTYPTGYVTRGTSPVATPLNDNIQSNISNESHEPLPSNKNTVPIDSVISSPSRESSNDKVTGANGDTDNSKNEFSFNPHDLPYQPVYNIEASPIPVRTRNKVSNDSLSPGTSTDTNTLNTEDLSPVSVDTIRASPIPVKPLDVKRWKDQKQDNLEPTKPSPVSVIPKNKDTSNKLRRGTSTDTNTLNTEDLLPVPINTIRASPIPVKSSDGNISKDQKQEHLEPTKLYDDLELSSAPVTSENKDISDKVDSDDSKDTNTLNTKDLLPVPIDTIGASPIPVKPLDENIPKDQKQDHLEPTKLSDDLELSSAPVTSENKGASDSLKQTYPTGYVTRGTSLVATPLNENIESNISNGSQEALSSNKNTVPIDSVKSSLSTDSSNDKVTGANGDTDNSKNEFSFNPNDLPYQPVYNIEASPIPVRTRNKVSNDSLNPGTSTDTNTLNTEDLSPVSVDTIRASPIPVKPLEVKRWKDQKQDNLEPTKPSPVSVIPKNKDTSNKLRRGTSTDTNTLNTEDLLLVPINTIRASPIPVKSSDGNISKDQKQEHLEPTKLYDDLELSSAPVTSENKDISDKEDSDDSKDTNTLNTKDLLPVPIDTIRASPIPVKSSDGNIFKDQKQDHLEPTKLYDDLELSSAPVTSENKDTSDKEDSDDSKDTNTLNTKDLLPVPIDTIRASPIPVKPSDGIISKNQKQDHLEPTKLYHDLELSSAPVTSENKDTSDTEDFDDSKDTNTFNPENSSSLPADEIGASLIPIKPQEKVSETQQYIPHDSATSDKSNETNMSGNETSNSVDENKNSKAEEPQNPLKDLVLNGTSSTKPKLSDSGNSKSIKPDDVVSCGTFANENGEQKDEKVASADAGTSKEKSEVSSLVSNAQSDSNAALSANENQSIQDEEKQKKLEEGSETSDIEQKKDE